MRATEQLKTRWSPLAVLAAVVCLCASSGAWAVTIAGEIISVEAGHVFFVGDEIQANVLELESVAPTCSSYRTFGGRRVCTAYDDAPAASMPDPAQRIALLETSDDQRYVVAPTEGYAAMEVKLEASLAALNAEADRVDVSVELAQGHAGAPVRAYSLNSLTGEYDLMGSYAGTADGFIRMSTSSLYMSSGVLTLLLVNWDEGIRDGMEFKLGGLFVDRVTMGVDDGLPIPEPSTALLTMLGLAGLLYVGRVRRG